MNLKQFFKLFFIFTFLVLLSNPSLHAQPQENQQQNTTVQSKSLFQQIKETLNSLLNRQRESNKKMTELREQTRETMERNKEAMQQAKESQKRSQLLQKQQMEEQQRILQIQKDLLLRQRR